MTLGGFWENAPQLHVIEQRIDMSLHRTLERGPSESTENARSLNTVSLENAEDSRGREVAAS
jgi:hypothetical protein